METIKISTSEPGKLRQLLATLSINLAALSYGMALGWASPVTPLLLTPQTPVGTEPMTSDQISWMNGSLCLSALAILPFCSTIAERFGRKITGYLIAVPSGLCWLLTIFATNYSYLLIARLCAGLSGGLMIFIVPLYVSEISGDSVRGKYGSILVFAINIGIVSGYVLGAVLSYTIFAICGFAVPVFFLCGFIFLPETPIYLIRKGRISDATRSLLWLKSNDKLSVENELSRLQGFVKESSVDNKSIGFRDLIRDKGTFRGFMISLALMGGQQFCGISAVITYTSTIFKIAGSSVDPDAATILVGVIQVIGSWLSVVMMERAGRRLLIMISCAGMAICHCTLGIFLLIQAHGHNVSSFSWIPVVAVSVFAIVYCLGMGPAPFVVASEVFASDISAFANSISMAFMWIIAFIMMKFFPFIMDILGIDGCFFLLATFCICTFFFTYFIIPETKGKNIELILHELNGVSGRFWNSEYQRPCGEIVKEKNEQTV